MKYQDFLKSKKIVHEHCGFNYTKDSEQLFPFQNHVVKKSLSAGKYGVFSGTGTGKTRMQLTII
jgi:ribose 5-phosphate isomerase RpiB